MEDFETFKASRLKIDPSSREMTDHQWKQSYAANRSARERVGISSDSEGRGNKRRKSKSVHSSDAESLIRGSQRPSTVSGPSNLRQVVRQQSAYADLRLIIDILAWVTIALFLMIAVISMFFLHLRACRDHGPTLGGGANYRSNSRSYVSARGA